MKIFNLCALLILFLHACTTQEVDKTTVKGTALSKNSINPKNDSNSFDTSGRLYYTILEQILATETMPQTTSNAILEVEAVGYLKEDFIEQLPSNYSSPSASSIDSIQNNTTHNTAAALASLPLTPLAHESLTQFIDTLLLYRDDEKTFDYIFDYIVAYETGINNSSTLNVIDKKILLTTASISRYAFYFASEHKRKPRDRDWEISWGNIIAGTKGSEYNLVKAVVMSATTAVLHNKAY